MKNIFMKEMKLFSNTMNILFMAFVFMLFIPSYPYYVGFFYVLLGIFFSFLFGRENKDLVYMSMLPIPKKDIVTGKYLFVVTIQLIALLLSVPVVVLRCTICNYPNQAGIDANIAFLGLVLIMMGIFNSVFLHSFFKKPEKLGTAFIKGCIAITLFYIAAEGSVFISNAVHSYCFWDSTQKSDLIRQIPILIEGVIIYILLCCISYRRDVKNFNKINIG